ncbi:MAG: DUF5723 family protein [Saprospiraceae bacterium]|nr:DUF5723 family protein [Saprospiraceae bacterium]
MKNIFCFILFLLSFNTLVAQTGLMGYGSKAVVPSMSANPALITDERLVIALPLVSSFQMEATTSFKLAEAMVKNAAGKTVFDVSKFAAASKDQNSASMNLGLDIFSVGFRVKSTNFVSFGVQHFSTFRGTASDDLLKLIAEGNAGKPVVSLDKESIYINQFNAFYAGWSRTFLNEKLTLATRLKMYQGIGNMQSDNASLTIKTDANSNPAYAISMTGSLQAEGAGIYGIALDSNLRKDFATNVRSNLFGMGRGFGIDIGANFKINDKITLSASAVNLGSITWKQDFARLVKVSGTGNFSFGGLKRQIGAEGQPTVGHDIDSIQSNFEKAFTLNTSKAEYSRALPSIIAAAVSYSVNDKHQVIALLRSQALNGTRVNLMGLKYQFTPMRSLQLMGGVSLMTDAPVSFGAGMVWSPGPFQLHFLADNIAAWSALDNNNYMQLQMGLNIVLKKKKALESK